MEGRSVLQEADIHQALCSPELQNTMICKLLNKYPSYMILYQYHHYNFILYSESKEKFVQNPHAFS